MFRESSVKPRLQLSKIIAAEGGRWVCPDLTDSGLGTKPKGAHMKTQLSKPARSKASYTDQDKERKKWGRV